MTRRTILQALPMLPLAASAPAFGQGERRYDILIKNGEVHDPARKFRQKADVLGGHPKPANEGRLKTGQ